MRRSAAGPMLVRSLVAMHHNSWTRAGKRLDVDCCIVFEIRTGRCIDGREYFFDLYAWDEFWS